MNARLWRLVGALVMLATAAVLFLPAANDAAGRAFDVVVAQLGSGR